MNIAKIAEIKDNFVAKEVAGELILVPLKDEVASMDELFTLNDVGLDIWNEINASADLESIVQSLILRYDVEESVLKQDVASFIKNLEDHLIK